MLDSKFRFTKYKGKEQQEANTDNFEMSFPLNTISAFRHSKTHIKTELITRFKTGEKKTYRLVVELTLVLLRDRRDIIESPQLTTVPLLIENVRNRYKSSL